MTVTLDKAIEEIRNELPADLQQQIAHNLSTYARKWAKLQSMLDQGVAELDEGRGVAITDLDSYISDFKMKHAK